MPYKDPEDKRKNNLKTTKNLLARHNSVLAQFPCKICGLKDPDLIDWHHIDPNEKEFTIKGKCVSQEDRWWNEVLKCIPLCCLCHRNLHKDKLCLLPIQR